MTPPTPPSSLVDEAAVEAETQICRWFKITARSAYDYNTHKCVRIARIITDAYADERKKVDETIEHVMEHYDLSDPRWNDPILPVLRSMCHTNGCNCLFCRCVVEIENLSRDSTAERAVREELVEGLEDIVGMEKATEIRLPPPFCGLGSKVTEDGYEPISSNMRLGFEHAAKRASAALAAAEKLENADATTHPAKDGLPDDEG